MTIYFTKYKLNGEFIHLSKNVESLFGYKPEELIGQSVYNYFHPEDLSKLSKAHLKVNFAQKIATETYRFRHKSGEYFWIKSYSEALTESGEIICINKKLNFFERIFFRFINKHLYNI